MSNICLRLLPLEKMGQHRVEIGSRWADGDVYLSNSVSPAEEFSEKSLVLEQAGLDVGLAAGQDAGLDVGLAAGQDAGLAAGQDAGLAAGLDVGLAAGQDAGLAAGQDAGQDVGLAAGQDAGLAAGQDVGQAAGQDAGLAAGLGLDQGSGRNELLSFYTIFYAASHSLAQAIYLSGLLIPPPLCSGLGRCVQCKMRFLEGLPEIKKEDAKLLSGLDLKNGWRLGCQHKPQAGQIIRLPASARLAPIQKEAEVNKDLKPANLAVDIGTTSIHWLLFEEGAELSKIFMGEDVSPKQKMNELTGNYPSSVGKQDLDFESGQNTGFLNNFIKGKMINPQMGAGSDIISRIAYALKKESLYELSSLTVKALKRVVIAGEKKGLKTVKIFMAANPAMTAISLGINPEGLAKALYTIPYKGGSCLQKESAENSCAADSFCQIWQGLFEGSPDNLAKVYKPYKANSPDNIGKSYRAGNITKLDNFKNNKVPDLFVAPQIAPFVGGDISAGYAWLKACKVEYPFLLADMGTNGEFLLALEPDKALAASVALGPAIEGIGLCFGSEARDGVINSFDFGPQGLKANFIQKSENLENIGYLDTGSREPREIRIEKRQLEGSEKIESDAQKTISGTGYLSLIHRLLSLKALSRQGAFLDNPLFGRYEKNYRKELIKSGITLPDEGFLALPYNLYLSALDVEEILKAKAAFSLSFSSLLKQSGSGLADIKKIYLAGALGEHADPLFLENLGFFPIGSAGKIQGIGNSSLAGAAYLLTNPKARHELNEWSNIVDSLDLSSDPDFYEDFAKHMVFSYFS